MCPRQTCIIFDWDDTILCTSILRPYEYLQINTQIPIPDEIGKHLVKLDNSARDLLIKAKKFGRVYIVTNA